MNYFKIYFSNGDTIKTGFNGTVLDAEAYYLNRVFNLGNGENDLMARAIKVELIA